MKILKSVLAILVLMVIANVASAQEIVPSIMVWKNGETEVSIAEAQEEGLKAEDIAIDADAPATRGGSAQDFSIECSFPAADLQKLYPSGVDMEVKWYYYMSTRKMLMSSSIVRLDPKDANDEGFVVLVCKPKQNLKNGWWEVTLKNKVTNNVLKYGGDSSYKVIIK